MSADTPPVVGIFREIQAADPTILSKGCASTPAAA